jgi:hypothetical protein
MAFDLLDPQMQPIPWIYSIQPNGQSLATFLGDVVIKGNGPTLPPVGAFGPADPSGATDSTAAFQAAAASGQAFFVPAGNYTLSQTISFTAHYQSMIGAGVGVTTLTSSSPIGPILSVAEGIDTLTISGMTLDRSVTVTDATASGIHTEQTGAPLNNPELSSLFIINQWRGLDLGPAAFGLLWNIISQSNYGDGVYFADSPVSSSSQWEMINVLAQSNNGFGFNVQETHGLNMTLGKWTSVNTYANTSGGYNLQGNTGRISDILFMQLISSGDGGTQAFTFSTNSENVNIGNVFIELAGQIATGRGLATPAITTSAGAAISNCDNVCLTNWTVSTCSRTGIVSGAGHITIGASCIINNSKATPGTYAGIFQSGGRIAAVGCRIGNDSGGTQGPAISVPDASLLMMYACDLQGSPTPTLGIGGNINQGLWGGNLGFVTQNGGAGSIPNAATTLVVNHGLASAPAKLSVTFNTDPGGRYWVTAVTATSFTVNLSVAAAGALNFWWSASVSNAG